MLVVVLIMGSLAMMAVPNYLKTMQMAKVRDGFGTMMMIGAAQEMCRMDNPASKDTSCPCAALSSTHHLVTGKYIANADWGTGDDYLRKPTFGTFNTTNSCSMVGMGWGDSGGSENTACMYFYSTNLRPAGHLLYKSQKNVCVKLWSDSKPDCP